MSLSDLKHLKDLSWYTTVPLFVAAWIVQDLELILKGCEGGFCLVQIVGTYFFKVLGGLMGFYMLWLFLVSRLGEDVVWLSLLFATFLLTLAGVGLAIYFVKPSQVTLPVNIIWFAALASVAFNIYQITENMHPSSGMSRHAHRQ